MVKGGGLCTACQGAKRGRAARQALAILNCERCEDGMCGEHAVWSGGHYVCLRCARNAGMHVKRKPGR